MNTTFETIFTIMQVALITIMQLVGVALIIMGLVSMALGVIGFVTNRKR